jgi:hypothetical protein
MELHQLFGSVIMNNTGCKYVPQNGMLLLCLDIYGQTKQLNVYRRVRESNNYISDALIHTD